MLRPTLTLASLASFVLSAAAQSGDWPGWRGPTGDGVAAEDASPPLEWGEDHNVKWKVELPGLGNSSPVVLGDRIYLTTSIDLSGLEADAPVPAQPGAPHADGEHRFIVMALDRTTGEPVWETVVLEETPHEKEHETGSHASASIGVSGERLVAFFGSRGLFVLDLDGEVLWSKDLGDMKTLEAFGEGSTPAVHGDTIVVQWDEEGPSFVAAFDLESGEERWRRARESDSSWGSPVVAEVGGRAQVILTGSDSTQAYDLATGETVWSCGGMSKNPVNTPVVADGVVYVMNSYRGNVVQAIRLAEAEGELDPEKGLVWGQKGNAAYVPAPVVYQGRLYFLRDSNGVLSCVDAATGDAHYTAARIGDVRRIHASPIAAAGRLYITSREGTTIVVQAGDEFQDIAMNSLDDVFDATPAFAGSEVFLRGRSHLYCVAELD